MKKRMIAFLMLGVIVFTVTGCKKNNSSDNYSTIVSEIWEDVPDGRTDNSGSENSNIKTPDGSNSSTGGGQTNNNSSGGNEDVSNIKLVQPVNINHGTKPVEEGVNFGGKTFTMAITEESHFHDAAFKRKIAAFEKKFNCKIKTVELIFGTYNTQIQAALSAGTSYDICFQQGSHYPVGINDGLYKSFSGTITTADLQNSSNPKAGGIDLAQSSYFAYKGEMYGLSHYYSSYPMVMFYNKKMCSAAGIDPQQLYKEGKWTWNYILQTGRKLTDASKDVYFLGDTSCVLGAFGASLITLKDGKPVANITSAEAINGYNFAMQLVNTSNPAARKTLSASDLTNTYDLFFAGKSYIMPQETVKWSQMAEGAAKSVAFGKNSDNVGIVPVPVNGNDKNKYPFGYLRCITAGAKTSDIRAAACFAKFEASYVDAVNDKKTVITGANKTFVDQLMSKTRFAEHGRFYTSSNNTLDITTTAFYDIQKGGDIAQITKKAQQDCVNAINATWK